MKLFDKKNRIWLIGGGVVLVILILIVSRGRPASGGGVQYVQSGPSEGAQLQMAAISAGLQQAQTQARAQEFSMLVQRDVAIGQLQNELSIAGINANVTSETLATQLAGLQVQLQGQQNLAQIEANARMAETAAYRDVTIAATNANFDMFALQTQANLMSDQLQAEIWNTQILTNRDIEVQRIASQERVQLDDNVTTRYGIGQQSRTQRQGNTLGFVGSILGGIGRLFSDVRAKSGIVQIGETKLGVPLYEYTINFNRQVGVMAQELALYDPSLVRAHQSGMLTVDYAGIDGTGY